MRVLSDRGALRLRSDNTVANSPRVRIFVCSMRQAGSAIIAGSPPYSDGHPATVAGPASRDLPRLPAPVKRASAHLRGTGHHLARLFSAAREVRNRRRLSSRNPLAEPQGPK